MSKIRFVSLFVLLALLLSGVPGGVLAMEQVQSQESSPVYDGEITPENHQTGEVPSPLTLTPQIIKRAEEQAKHRLTLTGEQVTLTAHWGNTTEWFTISWSSGDSRLNDYEAWNFYKINGREDLFYVEECGSAYSTTWPWKLTRFEPWMRSNTSNARLAQWDPNGQVQIHDEGQNVSFSLAYQGTGISTSFYPKKDTYNPYAWATHYSLEWRGSKFPNNTVGNNYVTRWYNGPPYGMQFAACGRGESWWGNCSDR